MAYNPAQTTFQLHATLASILDTGMRELLGVASEEDEEGPGARGHAINTLRLTFSHKDLANDVSGYFAEGEPKPW